MLTAAVTTLSHPSPMKRAITDEIEVQTCKLLLRNLRLLCDAFVTEVGADPGRRSCRLADVFLSLLQHVGDVVASLSLGADFVERGTGCKLDQGHSSTPLLINSKDAEVRNHHIDHAGSR